MYALIGFVLYPLTRPKFLLLCFLHHWALVIAEILQTPQTIPAITGLLFSSGRGFNVILYL